MKIIGTYLNFWAIFKNKNFEEKFNFFRLFSNCLKNFYFEVPICNITFECLINTFSNETKKIIHINGISSNFTADVLPTDPSIFILLNFFLFFKFFFSWINSFFYDPLILILFHEFFCNYHPNITEYEKINSATKFVLHFPFTLEQSILCTNYKSFIHKFALPIRKYILSLIYRFIPYLTLSFLIDFELWKFLYTWNRTYLFISHIKVIRSFFFVV